jgi:hypothetical protein
MMDMCRKVMLFGVLSTTMKCLQRKCIDHYLKDGSVSNDDFWILCNGVYRRFVGPVCAPELPLDMLMRPPI